MKRDYHCRGCRRKYRRESPGIHVVLAALLLYIVERLQLHSVRKTWADLQLSTAIAGESLSLFVFGFDVFVCSEPYQFFHGRLAHHEIAARFLRAASHGKSDHVVSKA